ncbi:alanine aminotransferase 2 isoform X2 [Amia ocellicauda]|uniref:alanine aminotransferase 2 isoform X2 n=1 Tax=Amia ocellicauda TaxID=2972642 RepID=UPI0034643402
MATKGKVLTLTEVNPMVRCIPTSKTDILVRRAGEITRELEQGAVKPFPDVIIVSSGDSHGAGMQPITFVRQVMAACLYPELLHSDRLPSDVRQRAQRLLGECEGSSVGSYSCPLGLDAVRRSVAESLQRRDGGVISDSDNIFIQSGSHVALMRVLKVLLHGEGVSQTGVLVPVPCHPRFTQAVWALGGVPLPFQLSEERGWVLEREELQRALRDARGRCSPRALYFVNPGNPTGHVQSRESIEEVIRLAAEESLFLLVDEVYQQTVFGVDREFVSYKKVLCEMGPPYSSTVQLASVHSVSKGFMGESGLRCGYVEFMNLDPQVKKHISSIVAKEGCAPIIGQIALDIMAAPPQPGDASYTTFRAVRSPCTQPPGQERQASLDTLAHNVRRVQETADGLPGVSYQPPQGGITIFLRLHLSHRAVEQAKALGLEPDLFYCMRLLEEEGVCAGPGCDLGQREGTYHLRLCILMPTDSLEEMLRRLKSFHHRFMQDFC